MRMRPDTRRASFEGARLRLLCLIVVPAMRLALLLTTYRRVARWMPRAGEGAASPHYARRVALRVRRAARFVPGATCLTQAVSAQFILARSGHRSTIHVGVEIDDSGALKAHAWLSCGGYVILGGGQEGLGRYTALAELG